MRKFIYTSIIIGLISTSHVVQARSTLMSPWDLHISYEEKKSDNISCPVPKSMPTDLNVQGFYKANGYGDTADKKRFRELKKELSDMNTTLEQVIKTADQYQYTQQDSYAECTAKWLEDLAHQGFLTGEMRHAQSKFQKTWALTSLSVSWLKIRNSSSITAEQKDKIPKWLNSLAYDNMQYWKKRKARSGNIYYSAAVGTAAAGIASNDQALYDWGTNAFDQALDSMTAQGYMEPEIQRGTKALSYLTMNAENLTLLAELAAANGENLYAHQNFKFNQYMNNILKALLDPSEINKVTEKKQTLTYKEYMGWLPSYISLFPSETGEKVLEKYQHKDMNFRKVGGAPPPVFIHSTPSFSISN